MAALGGDGRGRCDGPGEKTYFIILSDKWGGERVNSIRERED